MILLIVATAGRLPGAETLRYVRLDGGGLPAIVATEGTRIFVAAQPGGRGDLGTQTRRALANVESALAAAHASPADLVRLDTYVVKGANPEVVRGILREHFGTARAPNQLILEVPALPQAGGLIQISAMAVGRTQPSRAEVTLLQSRNLPQQGKNAAVSIARGHGWIYLSGQSDTAIGKHERMADMAELVRRSMQGMDVALKSAHASFGDLANLVVYVSSLNQLARLRQACESYFPREKVPPISYVPRSESDGANPWVEIDAEAALPESTPAPPRNDFISPEGLVPSRFYSYVVRAALGRTVYIAAQGATEPGGSLEQAQAAYDRIQRLLQAAGGTFRDVVKVRAFLIPSGGTYEAINTVRRRLYDPSKPPASTLLAWDGIAIPGAHLQIDAVAVIPGK